MTHFEFGPNRTTLFPPGTEWECEDCGRVSRGGILLHGNDCPFVAALIYPARAVPHGGEADVPPKDSRPKGVPQSPDDGSSLLPPEEEKR